MSVLKDLVGLAAAAITKDAVKGSNLVKDSVALIAGQVAGDASEKAAKKAGFLRENRFGNLSVKIPFFKTVDDKIDKLFSIHPYRKKVCFHCELSIREGINFYDPDGNIVYSIPAGKKNLKHLELYRCGSLAGVIDKAFTIGLNPLAPLQKYNVLVHGTNGIIRVNGVRAKLDIATWSMESVHGGNYNIINSKGEGGANIYSLGSFTYVFDYNETVNPAEVLLTFLAIKIRAEEARLKAKSKVIKR